MTPTPEPGSKPETFFEPDGTDAFAALEALQEELGPVPTTPPAETSKADTAIAIQAAKAKRAQKKKEGKATKDGYGQPQHASIATENSQVVRDLGKEMAVDDRNARDIALLQRVQMPHNRTSKSKMDDAPPLKATRPIKRASAWEDDGDGCAAKMTTLTPQGWVSTNVHLGTSDKPAKDDDANSWDGDAEEVRPASAWVVGNDDNSWDGSGDERAASKAKSSKASKASGEVIFEPPAEKDNDPWDSDHETQKKREPEPPVPKAFCGPSEGKVDHSSWDDDREEPLAMAPKKKSKSLRKKPEVEDEDDPTAGLDDLLDGKEVAIPVHQYVDGFQCTQCDFKVIRFQGFEWSPKAEYLFFRNYYGKPKKT
jgi:hypothetical protein